MWNYKFAVLILPLVLVFGQEKDHILFQHAFHVEDMELSCDECHSGVAEADGQDWSIFPEMDVCLQCHDDDTADGSCEYCHANPDDPMPISENWGKSLLGFSHKQHFEKIDDCLKCHSYIADDSKIGLPNKWNMENCLSCHKDLQEGPSSHDLTWRQFHGSEMNSNTSGNCALCHDNNSCDECHQLQEFTPNVHQPDFILAHGTEAKLGVTECSTCHEIIEDCYTCHVSNNVMPMNHNFINWVSFSEEGGLHGEYAESEADLCATCHIPSEDNSCVKCHSGD